MKPPPLLRQKVIAWVFSSLATNPMKLHNYLIDSAAMIEHFCALMRYVVNRLEGLQYQSYSIADEVALALSFANSSKGGGIDAGANRGA